MDGAGGSVRYFHLQFTRTFQNPGAEVDVQDGLAGLFRGHLGIDAACFGASRVHGLTTDLGIRGGVGVEELAVQAGVGNLNESFIKSGTRLDGIDGIDDQAQVGSAPAAPKLSSGGPWGVTGPMGMGDGRHGRAPCLGELRPG